jgi:CheY-like chemotaxis protein
LAFARQQPITPRVLDLNETVEGMLKMLRRLIGENIELVWQPAASLWPVRMDASQIDQILANLCVNARDAIAGVGRLTIRSDTVSLTGEQARQHHEAAGGDYVTLAISDDGCGMDAETRGRIFEPFFTTKGLGKGTGLGLATVYGIVKQNNGFIWVESEPGKGSTFTVLLPRDAGTVEPLVAPVEAERPSGRGETLLVVEDEASILRLAVKILEALGYRVLTAESPSRALELAESHAGTIRLLLADMVLPEMDGTQLAERIAALNPRIKSLFMSGNLVDPGRHPAMVAAARSFIQKPFTRQELARRVRAALDAP